MNPNEIDRTIPQKLYCQLHEILKNQIGKGGWAVGAQIPTEEQLSSQYNVSKATVRLALAELVSMGYLKKMQGKGTFVRRKKPENRISVLMNLDDADVYYDTSNIIRIIENKTFKPLQEIGDCLYLSDDDHCLFISRLIITNGSPLLLQKLYVPYGLLPGIVAAEEITSISPYHFLEGRCGIKIKRMTETTDLTHLSKEEADLLELTYGATVLRIKQICYANGDAPVSFSESLYRTDSCARTVEFERLRI
ncbi:MAG: GntR family transcriptional regulator [Thermodesulfovibrionales bacterium]|jgi:DNA-binding GntR family transcriptional regulator